MNDYPPGYTPNDPPDDLDDTVREEWTSKTFRGAWARAQWDVPGTTLATCCVCGQVVEADADGKRRFEGVVTAETKRWIWGPYPCHDACRTEVVTPHDDNPTATPAWERL